MSGLMSDEDFEFCKQVIEQSQSSYAKDPQAMKAAIESFERDIADLLASKEEGWREAVIILAQGRNFFAKSLGLPQKAFLEDPDARVALFVRSGESLTRALQQVLGFYKQDLRFEIYSDMRKVLEGIVAGSFCGVIGIDHGARNGWLEGQIRHDLKNMEGWNAEKAASAKLPLMAEFGMGFLLSELICMMREMQSGASVPLECWIVSEDGFSLSNFVESLVGWALIPKLDTHVVVLDDDPEAVKGILFLLEKWPNVIHEHILYSDLFSLDEFLAKIEAVGSDRVIVLLDESMGATTGTAVAKALESRHFGGITASITGGAKPRFAKHHFWEKKSIASQRGAAVGFVQFMNQLIRELESR